MRLFRSLFCRATSFSLDIYATTPTTQFQLFNANLRVTRYARCRLVYVNDVFVPSLSITAGEPDFECYSESDVGKLSPELEAIFEYLPDGVSDEFPYKETTTRNKIPLSVLSGKDHMVGPYNGQAAVNNQQGTGAFAALNSLKCNEVSPPYIYENNRVFYDYTWV